MALGIRRAMVVDDDKNMRKLICLALEMCGCHQVIEIDNASLFFGGAAIVNHEDGSLKDGRSDIVFLDWKMPHFDGIECAKLLRSGGLDGFNPNIPIVMLTGWKDEGVEEIAMEAGVTIFLNKPAGLKEIINAISTAVEKTPSARM